MQSIDSPKFMNGLYGEVSSAYQALMRTEIDVDVVPDSHRFAKPKQDTIELFERLMEVSDDSIRITPKMGLVDGLKKRGVTPLKRDCVCSTLTSIPDDFIHYSEPRIMTVRESARIQSFPDDYVFWENIRQVGNEENMMSQGIHRLQMLYRHYLQSWLD